ncbi:hypothetical protein NXY56_000839 [Leishmania guyanensis]|uniref:Uncharacterized protein n=1 Tax=Leishmania guyanensis TaxID=5670 RepID=A0A1E1ISF7_LEIGU|nr:hypothetical protein, conserved [Leishmania guyanensis]
MGILPSRESHEYPGAFHFAQSGSHAMAILPLTEHFFPSVESLAFKQLYAGRDMQSAKYNFSLISPELLRKYQHRSMEENQMKEDVVMAPPAGRSKPQPYLRHGQPPGDDSDTDEKWVGVDTIDASNYSQFFKDDTHCVSPNELAPPFLDGDEEVCEELRRPNPAAHWHTHDAAKQLIQGNDNELGFVDELNYVSFDGKGGGLRCLPSSRPMSCSSSQHPRHGQPRNASTEATADGTAATVQFTPEERDLLNRFFARSPEALYNALVVEPNRGFLVDTNKEMCSLYAAEKRWKEARNIVRAYRRQYKQGAAAGNAAQSAAGKSPNSPKCQPQPLITKEEADEAATVPPPPVFLRPVPQVIMVRMSREEEEATRTAHLEEQQRIRRATGHPHPHQSGDGDTLTTLTSSSPAPTGTDEGSRDLRSPTPSLPSPLHVPTTRYHRFEDDPKYKDGRIHLVEEDGVLYMFAYNTAYVDPRLRVRQQREELLKQQHQREQKEQPEGPENSLEKGEACRSSSSVAAAGATTEGSEGSSTTEFDAAAAHMTDGDDDGALCQKNRQTSSFYHTVSAFGNEEDEAGPQEHGTASMKAKDETPTHASTAAASPVASATIPAVSVTQVERNEEQGDEEKGTALSSTCSASEERQRQQCTTIFANDDDDAGPQRPDGKLTTSSDDDDDDDDDGDGDERRKDTSASTQSVGMTAATSTGTTSAATEERSRMVRQLELVTAAPFILPICPVRVVGCNGYAESSCRGTPWLRGYEDDPEEDAYVESLPVKPPIMSGGGFIDANIGDKILSRAYLLGFQVYRNVCLDAGLPETLTRPFWTLGLLSNIPLLQISREMRFRMRAAAAEVELGYRGLRDMIKGTENDLQSYIYGFSDILPYLERASRARVEQAEAEAKAAAAAEGGDSSGANEGAADSRGLSSLLVGHSPSESVEDASQQLQDLPVSPAIPTRSLQAGMQQSMLFPRNEMEFYTQFTIRGNQSLSRVRCEAQESFFHLIAEATAPVSTSLFMKPLELPMYDYGGAIRLHLMCNRVTGADELQVLPPPRNLNQLFSDHQQRLQLRRLQLQRQCCTSADDKGELKSNAKGGKESADGDSTTTAPPYLIYTVVHPSGKARGPSLEHYKRNLQAPDDGADANTLDEAEVSTAATDSTCGDGGYAAHQYTYPPDSFVDSDMVIYNIHKGRWEHFEYFHHQQLAQRRARKLQAQAEKEAGEPDSNQLPAQSNKDTTDAASVQQATTRGEACQDALVTCSGGRFAAVDEDEQDIHLEDILLCWIKRRLQSATMRNRVDPGWLRDSEGHIVQEGRYYIWGFEQDGQQYFYGLIPKFAKEKKNKRHNTIAGNAHNQHHHDSHNRRSNAQGNLSGPSSVLNSHPRPKIGGGSDVGNPAALGILSSKSIDSAQAHQHLMSGDGSTSDSHSPSPGACNPAHTAINGQMTDERGSGSMENMGVRSESATARESAKNYPTSVPTPMAVAPSVSMSDVKGGVGSEHDTGTGTPLNVVGLGSYSKQQQHLRSPGAVGGGSAHGVTSPGCGATSATTARAGRSSHPSSVNSGPRLPVQTSGAHRSSSSQQPPPPTSSAPGAASAALAGRQGMVAVGHGSPSRSGSAVAPLLSSVVIGGVAAETGASYADPRTIPQCQGDVNLARGRSAASCAQQLSNSATTAAQFSHQSISALAAAASTSAEDVRNRQRCGERRDNRDESSRASPPPPPAARQYLPHAQELHLEVHPPACPSSAGSFLLSANPVPPQQQGRLIIDPSSVILGYKGALQSRYHAPPPQQQQQHQQEYRQAPPSTAYDNSSSNSYGGGSGASRHPAASHASGHSYLDMPPPPPPSSPPPPLTLAGAENALYEQPHQSYPAPVDQQHHHPRQQRPLSSSTPPLHLHLPTAYMNTGASQASLRPTSTLDGPCASPLRPAQQQQAQQQQYTSYYTGVHYQQPQVSHQASYKAQPVMASVVTGARAHGPCHHHSQQQQQMTVSAPNSGPAAPPLPPVQAHASMNTGPSRYALHPRLVTSGSGVAPMQPQQQLTSVAAASVAPPSALVGETNTYYGASPVSVAPSGSRATSYYPMSLPQASYDALSQTAASATHPAGLQDSAAPPHTGHYPPAPLKQLPHLQPQQQVHPSSTMMEASTASGQGSVANQFYPQQHRPPSPSSGPASAAPASACYGQMTSPTSQQQAYLQQSEPRNANYDGGSRDDNYSPYAASTANNNAGSSGSMNAPILMNANPNTSTSFNRVGLSLPTSAAAKAVTGGSGTSIVMGNPSLSLSPAGSSIGRGAQGYALQSAGYPTSASGSFTATPVVAVTAGATTPAASMIPRTEGSAVKVYSLGQAPQHPQQQASVGGRVAEAPSPTPHPYRTTTSAQQHLQQQQDSRYPSQAMTQSYSSDYNNGNSGASAMTTGGRPLRSVAMTSDGMGSSSHEDSMMHGSRGAHAAAGEYQLPHPQQQQYQQRYPQWQPPQQLQQHHSTTSSQPSSCAPTPLPVQHHYSSQAGSGSDSSGTKSHTHAQAACTGATGKVNASSVYAHKQRASPHPQHAGAQPTPLAAAVGSGGGGGRGSVIAVAAPAAVAHVSLAMHGANPYSRKDVATASVVSPASTQASSAAVQQQRRSESYGYRPSCSESTLPYSQGSQQQRLVTRPTAATGLFHRGASGSVQTKTTMSAGSVLSVPDSHSYSLHQRQRQPSSIYVPPAPDGGYQHQSLAHPPKQQRLTPTANASGTLLRTAPGSQQRYEQLYPRQQQQKSSSPYTSTQVAADLPMQMTGSCSTYNTHSSTVGTGDATYDSNSSCSAAAQRFAHNPYSMQ